jgi:hypothetical protein
MDSFGIGDEWMTQRHKKNQNLNTPMFFGLLTIMNRLIKCGLYFVVAFSVLAFGAAEDGKGQRSEAGDWKSEIDWPQTHTDGPQYDFPNLRGRHRLLPSRPQLNSPSEFHWIKISRGRHRWTKTVIASQNKSKRDKEIWEQNGGQLVNLEPEATEK